MEPLVADELKDIETQIAQLQAKKQAMLEARRGAALEEVKAAIATFGFSASDLGFKGRAAAAKVAGSKAKAKYQNPANSSQTWAGGKGRVPSWIKEHEDKGGSREDFLIKE